MPNLTEVSEISKLMASLKAKNNLRSYSFNSHERPKLVAQDPSTYFENNLSSRTRAKLRQELRRIGAVEFETIVEPADVCAAIEEYIELEGRGWKGRIGTAVSCSEGEADFLRKVAAGLSRSGRIKIQRMKLDGRTLASSITYFSSSMAWYAKISFDESQAKNSPGSHLVMYATETLLKDASLTWVDSCAPPGHPLMKKFWKDGLSVSNQLIDPEGTDLLYWTSIQLERLRLKISDAWNAYKASRNARIRKK